MVTVSYIDHCPPQILLVENALQIDLNAFLCKIHTCSTKGYQKLVGILKASKCYPMVRSLIGNSHRLIAFRSIAQSFLMCSSQFLKKQFLHENLAEIFRKSHAPKCLWSATCLHACTLWSKLLSKWPLFIWLNTCDLDKSAKQRVQVRQHQAKPILGLCGSKHFSPRISSLQ